MGNARGCRRQPGAKFAWFLLVASLVGWPVSLVWWAREEPPFVLSLSWLALTLTALDVLFTADVRREQDTDTEAIKTTTCPHCGHVLETAPARSGAAA